MGWVLFEADRVMKSYDLRRDNESDEPIITGVPGYEDVLDRYFENDRVGSVWHRFWIVPAEVERREAKNGPLTLLDVPLKVRTERKVMVNGDLKTAADATPTPGAAAFASWFTNNYAAIADEVRKTPPKDHTTSNKSFVFTELQRIALISAIAEYLRDQGVPMPRWMRTYTPRSVTVPRTTQAIEVKRCRPVEQDDLTRNGECSPGRLPHSQVYGGVTLSPADRDVRTLSATTEEEALAIDLKAKIDSKPILTPVSFERAGVEYEAVALPGPYFHEVGALRLAETDLIVPAGDQSEISLVRRFNSFFLPRGVFGGGWTLDLPRLELRPVQIERDHKGASYRDVHQLSSPLGTWLERFSTVQKVSHKFSNFTLSGELPVPDRSGSPILGIVGGQQPRLKNMQTDDLLFRDGRRWQFSRDGDLVAQSSGASTTLYHRDNLGRVSLIEGWENDRKVASIELDYRDDGRLNLARAGDKSETRYDYDESGALKRVEGPHGVAEYKYENGLVSAIVRNGQPVARFEYDSQGRVLSVWRPEDGEKRFNWGSQIAGTDAEKPEAVATTDIVPLKPGEPSGAVSSRAEVVAEAAEETRDKVLRLPTGGTLETIHNAAGRVVEIRKDDAPVLLHKWNDDGRLVAVDSAATSLRPRYGTGGNLEGYRVQPSDTGHGTNSWVDVKLDSDGRPTRIQDFTGGEATFAYNENGDPETIRTSGQEMSFTRDSAGRLTSVKTGDGAYQETYEYNQGSEDLKRAVIRNDGAEAVFEFESGLPKRIRQFDGGEWKFEHEKASDGALPTPRLTKVRAPNDLGIAYRYNDRGDLAEVGVGDRYRIEMSRNSAGLITQLRYLPSRP